VRLCLGQRGHAHRAGYAHAAEVVAHEVDDHRVLGAVLGRGLELRAPRRRPRALDRRGADGAAAALEEQLGGEAGDRAPRALEVGGAVRRERLDAAREQLERRALDPCFEPPADVGLEQVAGVDALAARRHDRGMAGRAGDEPPAVRVHVERRRGRGEQRVEPRASGRGVRALGQRLEPPAPGGIEPQHVVVAREHAGGRRRRVER
jgi:hypothetical protein